jgi:hypothetical protein
VRRGGSAAARLRAWEAASAAAHAGPEAPVCGAAAGEARAPATDPRGLLEAEVVRCLPAGLALVRTAAGTREIHLAYVGAQPGDTVLVHAGDAVAVL